MIADEYETSAAAYVLGSLSEQERLAFEAHLKTCARCPARMSEARALVGLLTMAPEFAFDDNAQEYPLGETPPEAPMPETLLPRLLRQLHRERGRRRLVAAGAMALAAACVVAALVVVLPRHADPAGDPFQPPLQASAMTNVAGATISAEVQVTTKDTWAQVNLWCTYGVRGFDPGTYQAVARTTSGRRVVIGSWPGVPGNRAIIRTPTGLHTVDITSIEIVSPTGKTLAWTTI